MPVEKYKHAKNQLPKIENEASKLNNKRTSSSRFDRRNTDFKIAVNDAIVKRYSLDEKKIEKVLGESNVLSVSPLVGKKSFVEIEKVNRTFIKNLLEEGKLINKKSTEKETTCEICYSTTNHMVEIDACCHIACLDCWTTYAEGQIKTIKVRRGANESHITCLYNGCGSVLSLDFLSSILPHNLVQRYIRFYCELKLIKSEEYIPCPKDYCDRVILVNNNLTDNISICECNYAICNKCNNEAHFPITCEEATVYTSQFDSDKSAKIEIPGKFCPRCRRFIEKNGGCNHMTCICGYEFCWICCSNYYKHTICRVVTLKNFHVSFLDTPKMQEVYELASRSSSLLPKSIINQDVNRIIQSVKSKFIKSFENCNKNEYDALMSLDMVYKTLIQLNFNLNYLISFCKYSAVKQIANYSNKPQSNKQAVNILVSTSRLCFQTQKLLNNAKDLDDLCTLLSVNLKLKEKLKNSKSVNSLIKQKKIINLNQ